MIEIGRAFVVGHEDVKQMPPQAKSLQAKSVNGGAGSKGKSAAADRIYMAVLFLVSLTTLLLIVAIAIELWVGSLASIHKFGFHFLVNSKWDPNHEILGALPFILGTLYTSFWALLIAVPISIGSAIFLSEIAPPMIRRPLGYLIELLAAIPSVVYGLCGVFVLSQVLANAKDNGDKYNGLETLIFNNQTLNKWEIFKGAPNGTDLLCASIILAIMVIPFITSVTRELLLAIPKIAREGSYGVGATKWETIQGVVLPFARPGIIGAVILGLGRALGETMAVTMVIGNADEFKFSLFSAGNTMASVIANEFTEASTEIYRSSLTEIGLSLFAVTLVVNGIARMMVRYMTLDIQTGKRR
jgi:phosphate transport system permease protein